MSSRERDFLRLRRACQIAARARRSSTRNNLLGRTGRRGFRGRTQCANTGWKPGETNHRLEADTTVARAGNLYHTERSLVARWQRKQSSEIARWLRWTTSGSCTARLLSTRDLRAVWRRGALERGAGERGEEGIGRMGRIGHIRRAKRPVVRLCRPMVRRAVAGARFIFVRSHKAAIAPPAGWRLRTVGGRVRPPPGAEIWPQTSRSGSAGIDWG